MKTNAQVRAEYNITSKRYYGKSYKSLNSEQADMVRRITLRDIGRQKIAASKKRKRRSSGFNIGGIRF